jgi:hypothetical protein
VDGRPDGYAWGEAVDGLALGIAAAAEDVAFALHNGGDHEVDLPCHVLADGQEHLDWYVLHVHGPHDSVAVPLLADRNRSAPVRITLPPGGHVVHVVTPAAWIGRGAGSPAALPSGPLTAEVTFDTTTEDRGWRGRLHSGSVRLPDDGPPER